MIDLIILVGRTIKGHEHLNRVIDSLPFYMKYRNSEIFFSRKNLTGYLNDFMESDLSNIFYEDDEFFYFIIGKVFLRNRTDGLRGKQLNIKQVVETYINNKTHLHKIVKGDYIIISIERNSGRTTILNSPLGVKAFYYNIYNKQIILSTNLTILLKLLNEVQINETGLVMYSMFDTLLGNNTIFKNIFSLQFGEKVEINNGQYKSEIIYDHLSCFHSKPVKRNESIELLCNTLKNNMSILPTKTRFLLGLTGGFDSRLNLALIDKEDYKNIIGYTYGMDGSKEIEIAKLIASKSGIEHKIIFLDEEYVSQYINNADEVLMISDGYAPFMRCNYLYSHKILSQYSRECITGMFGSELIRPMHVMPDSVSLTRETAKAFLSTEPLIYLQRVFNNQRNEGFLRQELFNSSTRDDILGFLEKKYINNKEAPSKEYLLQNFYINEGMRKFFMEIIRVDRFFVNHNIPFLDLDFFERIMNTNYAGIHNNAFRENPFLRRKGQLLYVDVIDRFSKELNNIKVDRGYYPYQLKGGINWVFVALGFYFGKKLRKKIKGNDTFNTKIWRNNVYMNNIQTLQIKDPWFNDLLLNRYKDKFHLIAKNEHYYARHYSLKRWLELIRKYVSI